MSDLIPLRDLKLDLDAAKRAFGRETPAGQTIAATATTTNEGKIFGWAVEGSLDGQVLVRLDTIKQEQLLLDTEISVSAGDYVRIIRVGGHGGIVTGVIGGGDRMQAEVDAATQEAAAANVAAAALRALADAQALAIAEASALLAGAQLEATTQLGLAVAEYQEAQKTFEEAYVLELSSEVDSRRKILRDVYETDENGQPVLDDDDNPIWLYTEMGREGSDFFVRQDGTRTWYVYKGSEVSTYGTLGLEAPKAWLKGDQTGTALTMGATVKYDWIAKANGNLSLKVRSS